MHSLIQRLLVATTLATQAYGSNDLQKRGPSCTAVKIPVSITADNIDLPPTKPGNVISIIDNLAKGALHLLTVDGNYTLAGRYCEPEVTVPGRENTVQLLVHGATYNKDYWSGMDYPEGFHGNDYSWIAYASRQGYPTLSIDRLGTGDSDKPDPVTVTQLPVDAEALYKVILALRAGSIDGISKSFEKVVYIGHSLGSFIGNTLSARHGDSLDALVLTGYAKDTKEILAMAFVNGIPLPAALWYDRLRDVPEGYIVLTSRPGRQFLMYSSSPEDYDPDFPDFDYDRQDTFALGDGVSAFFAHELAKNYTGPVHVVNGQNDNVICSLALPIISHGDCGEGDSSLTAQVRTLYPSASNFSYANIPTTGHDLNNHYSINKTMDNIHQFLEDQGF